MNALATAPLGSMVSQLETAPITRFDLALFCGASGDHNPVHVDIDFARAAGHQDVFVHGMLVMAYLGRLLPQRELGVRVESFTCRFVSMTHVADRLDCTARLKSRELVGRELRIGLGLTARILGGGPIRASARAVLVFDH